MLYCYIVSFCSSLAKLLRYTNNVHADVISFFSKLPLVNTSVSEKYPNYLLHFTDTTTATLPGYAIGIISAAAVLVVIVIVVAVAFWAKKRQSSAAMKKKKARRK